MPRSWLRPSGGWRHDGLRMSSHPAQPGMRKALHQGAEAKHLWLLPDPLELPRWKPRSHCAQRRNGRGRSGLGAWTMTAHDDLLTIARQEGRAYPCGCGCGIEVINAKVGQRRVYASKVCRARADNARKKVEAEEFRASRAASAPEPEPIGISGPAPAFCGLCPLQSKRGNRPCTHRRLASRWMNEPASEARIHGACPWGRPVLQGDATCPTRPTKRDP